MYGTANAPDATRPSTPKRLWAALVLGSVAWLSFAWAVVDWLHADQHQLLGRSTTMQLTWLGLVLVYSFLLSTLALYPQDEQNARWTGEARVAGPADLAAASRHSFDWWQQWVAL